VFGLLEMLTMLPVVGRVEEARAIANETVRVVRAHGNPFLIVGSLSGYGRAFADTEPTRALDAMRQALAESRAHRLVVWEAIVSREVAGIEAVHGDPCRALALFEVAIDSLHRAGEVANIRVVFAEMAVLFDGLEHPEIAATLYGATHRHGDTGWVRHLAGVPEHLRMTLGDAAFDDCVAAGAAMELNDAVAYARNQIHLTRQQLRDA